MSARTITRPLALLAGAAILVAACGSGTATTAPVTQAPVTQAPVTQAPATQAPAGTGSPEFSFDTSSFHADVDLEALFPDEIGGEPLTVLSMSGADMMGEGGSPELQAMLTALGKTPADLTAAFGGVAKVGIVAFQIKGAPGDAILAALRDAYETSDAVVTDMSFGGKAVKKFVPADPDESTGYIYVYQDVIFLVSGEGATEAVLNEVFSKLP